MKIACIGEAMIELSMAGDHPKLGVAGDTLNAAVYLKRGGPDLVVDYVTRLGTDPYSAQIRDFITKHDIGTTKIKTDSNQIAGLYAINLDDAGERTFTYWRGQSAARAMFQTDQGTDFGALDGYDALYLSGISLAILPLAVRMDLRDYLAASKATVAFDSNYRPRLWEDRATAQSTINAFWDIADIAMPSIDDEMDLFDETSEQVAARFIAMDTIGALKRGPEGPLSLGEVVTNVYAPAPRVVDTTAAGDSFNGGYLAAKLQGATQSDALLAGHNCAAYVVQHRGAIAP